MIRFAHRLADRDPSGASRVRFARALGLTSSGEPIRVVDAMIGQVRYALMPWPYLSPSAVRKRFLHDMRLYGHPRFIRWVFSRERVGVSHHDLVQRVRRMVTGMRAPATRLPQYRAWLQALPGMIVAI